jgi:hypothetical protein
MAAATAQATGIRCARRGTPNADAPQTLLAQIAEPLPIAREVSGQEQDHQNLDGFDRLKRSQVDLLVADPGPVPKRSSRANSTNAASSGV